MTDHPPEPAVPLADAEIAQRIADAARTGGPADRTPTVEQLLTAFGEQPEAGAAARERVARALAVAGVAVTPPLPEAPAGSRVTLAPGRGGPGGRGPLRALALGGLALTAIIVAVAVAASLGDGGDGDERASSLPSGTGTATTTTAATPTPAERAAAEKARREREAKEAAAKRAAQQRERRAAAERKAEQAAARKARERAAAAKRRLVVTLSPAVPTYVCIDDGAGRRLFGGTLSAPQTFRARRMRLNIGLSSVAVKVNGKPLALQGSPSGYLLEAGRAPQYLPLGRRPEC